MYMGAFVIMENNFSLIKLFAKELCSKISSVAPECKLVMSTLFVFRSLDGMLRYTTEFQETHSAASLRSIEVVNDEDVELFLLFVESCPDFSDLAATFKTFEPPQEKGNWGINFSKMLDLMMQRNINALQCSQSPTDSSLWPEQECTYYDHQYRRWQTSPHDISASLAEETGYDWEIIDHSTVLLSSTGGWICDTASVTESVDNLLLHDEFVLCSPYKDALLKHRETDTVIV